MCFFSYRVNSREVRKVVEEIIDESEVKPSTIRFFRGAMFNMVSIIMFSFSCVGPAFNILIIFSSMLCGLVLQQINIALSEIDVIAKPSRCTFALANWLEQRNRDVYPKMEG